MEPGGSSSGGGTGNGGTGGGGQQYCMRWNTHGTTVLAELTQLLSTTSLVDVTLFAEGHTLKAHKVVLSACSPYFKRLFSETREGHPIVVLKDVGHQELRCLLEYMYRGEVNVAHDQLEPLIRTAESLRIKGLADGPRNVHGPPPQPPGPVPTPPAETPVPPPPDRVKVKMEDATERAEGRLGRNGAEYSIPPVSVPSVLSKVLTMPPALSLSAPLPPPDTPVRPMTPPNKRRRRRRSGDGDSESERSSPDPLHSLPRIPATITPVSAPTPLPQDEERHIGMSGSGGSSPSPESLGGSSKGETALNLSPQPRPLSAHEAGSPFKPFLPRADESSSDANHRSDDEDDRLRTGDHGAPDTPGPSTSRLPPPDDSQTHGYLGWPYPPDPSTSSDSAPFPSLENTNQGLLLCEGWLATGLWGAGRGADERKKEDKNCNGREREGRREGREGRREEKEEGIAHSCPKCHRTYTLRSNLSRHIRLECGVERRYKCAFCHKRFSHAHHLRSHEKSIHAHPTPTPAPSPTAAQT